MRRRRKKKRKGKEEEKGEGDYGRSFCDDDERKSIQFSALLSLSLYPPFRRVNFFPPQKRRSVRALFFPPRHDTPPIFFPPVTGETGGRMGMEEEGPVTHKGKGQVEGKNEGAQSFFSCRGKKDPFLFSSAVAH